MKYNFKYFLILYFFVFTSLLFSSFERKEAGAREQSLGNAIVALNNSIYAIYYNPANIYSENKYVISTSYRNFYSLPGIYQADIVLNIPSFGLNSAFAASKFGNHLYSEIQIGAGTSYKLSNHLSLGLSFQGYFLSIKNYGNTQNWGLNVGFQYEFYEQLSIGAQITNINNSKIGKINEEIPKTFSLGFNYEIIKDGNLLFEFFRDVKFEQDYRGAFEYTMYNNLQIRLGIMDNTNTYSFGFGSTVGFFKLDYALINHSILGISHSIAVGVTF